MLRSTHFGMRRSIIWCLRTITLPCGLGVNNELIESLSSRPDDLPTSVTRQEGDTADLRAFFADWDPLLNVVLSQVDEVQKWKLMHLPPLERWTRGAVALMGDACHPTLPYQAQGAAMAVEDGATIAEMLGLLSQSPQWADDTADQAAIAQTLQRYEQVRKQRTELNVRGADANRIFLHLPRGLELEERDQMLREWDWNDSTASSKWPFLDPTYARELMGFDAEAEARAAFERKFGPGGVDSSSPRHSRDNVP